MSFTYDTEGAIKVINVTWTSNGSGAASGTTRKVSGELHMGKTIPSATAAPTANYDITLTDSDSFNILSVTDADLQNRHTSNTEAVYFLVQDHGTPSDVADHPVVCSTITVTVANAGDTKSGTLRLYLNGDILPHET